MTKLKKYLISRDTQTFINQKEEDQLDLYTQRNYINFKVIPFKDGEKEWTHSSFEFEMVAEEEQDEEIVRVAIKFAMIYGWGEIDIWKGELDDDEYHTGVCLRMTEKGIPADYEVVVGCKGTLKVNFDKLTDFPNRVSQVKALTEQAKLNENN